MKKIIPVIILSMIFGACSMPGTKPKEGAEGEKAAAVEVVPEEENIIPVEVTKAQIGSIQRDLKYAGQVKPVEKVTVTPKLGGKVSEVNYDVGDKVASGNVLFVIDAVDIQSSINAAEAQYNASLSGVQSAQAGLESISGAQAESTILQLETAVNNAQLGIENTELQISNAQLALDSVTVTYENSKLLYDAGVISKADFDKVKLGYDQAAAGLEAARLANTQAQIGKNQAQEALNLYRNKTKGSAVKQAQSGVSQASSAAAATKVQLDNAKRNLSDLSVKSPISGVVTERNVQVGVLTGQGAPAYTIINMDTVEINTSISEELINIVKKGDKVPVYINSISEKPFSGEITTISPAADEMKNTYPVKISIPNKDGTLKPGMFAEVHFTKEKSTKSVVMPRNTVLEEEGVKYVFIAEGDTAKKVFIETGIDNGKDIEITSGLTNDMLVITKGHTKIADGEKIKIVDGGGNK